MKVDFDVSGWLQKSKREAPSALQPHFAKFEQLYDQKLYHQLTLEIEEFVKLPAAAPFLMPLYTQFIAEWEDKMNRISLVQLLSLAAAQQTPVAALEFLGAQAEKLKDDKVREASALCIMECAHYKLLAGDVAGCKAAIAAAQLILDSLTAVLSTVNATFYRVSADYYKVTLGYPQYYHNALLYLSSLGPAGMAALPLDAKWQRAHDLAMSALLGEGLYNFGELLMHPILESLVGSPHAWLRTLLLQYNSGDLEGFEKIIKTAEFLKAPLLVSSIAFLRQKLCLMTLVESVFSRNKAARESMSFVDISRECRVAVDEVEHLCMKALALGLVRGHINEAEKIVVFTWVQPRILSKAQIGTIRERIAGWTGKVDGRVAGLEKVEGFSAVYVQ